MRSRNRHRQRALGAMTFIGSTMAPVIIVAVAEATPATPSRSGSTLRADITSVKFLQKPTHSETTRKINKFALPQLKRQALYGHGEVHTVSGATYTSRAFRKTLQYALTRIANSDVSKTVTTQTVHVRYDINYIGDRMGHAGRMQLKVTGHRYEPTPQPTYTGSPQPVSAYYSRKPDVSLG